MEEERTRRGGRFLTALAVGSLAVFATIGFSRVFTVRQPALRLVAVAIASVALASLLDKRPLAVSILLSAAALLILLGVAFFPSTTWHWLPTMATLRGLRDMAVLAGTQARIMVAPAPPVEGLMLTSSAAVWAATFASHSLAARGNSPVLASLPLLALFTFADSVLGGQARPGYAVLVLAGVIAVVFADGLRRVRRWGPLEVWTGPSKRRTPDTVKSTRGARGIAAAVIAVAAFLPGILPGWGHGSLVDLTGLPGAGDTADPFVSIKASLSRSQPEDLFEVHASRPAYWRTLSLDRFDGVTWSIEDLELEGQDAVGPQVPLGSPLSGIPTETLHQDIRTSGLRTPWLPMAYQPSTISLPGGDKIRYDADRVMAVGPDPLPDGYTYSVESTVALPTWRQLDGAANPASSPGQSGMSPEILARYTQLPPDTSSIVRDTALRVTHGQPNEFRKMIALQAYLRTHFTYDETETAPGNVNPLQYFLGKSHRGFCQQFAGAMAAIARYLGYPARVAVGFLPGDYTGGGMWRVTTDEAHAWPEVFFPTIGWVAFEPTPGRSVPLSTYLSPPAFGSQPLSTGEANAIPGQRPNASHPNLVAPRRHGRHVEPGSPSALPPRRSYVRRALPVVALATVLAFLLIPVLKAAGRRLKLRRTKEARRRVFASFEVFSDRAGELGLGRRPAETLSDYGERLRSTVPFSDGNLESLLGAASKAAYSASPVLGSDAERAGENARQALRDMRGATPLRRKLRGAFRLSYRYGERPR